MSAFLSLAAEDARKSLICNQGTNFATAEYLDNIWKSHVKKLIAVLAAVFAHCSQAALLVDQVGMPSQSGIASQTFVDSPTSSVSAFDDFTLTQSYRLTGLTVEGIETGKPDRNVAVTAQIWSGLPGSGSMLASFAGTQLSDDLVFDLDDYLLDPGTYWMTAFVTRPAGDGGGQFFVGVSTLISGSEAYFFNPGNGFRLGTAPVTLDTAFPDYGSGRDLAFRLSGDAVTTTNDVPEPGSLALVGLGLAALAAGRRRKAA